MTHSSTRRTQVLRGYLLAVLLLLMLSLSSFASVANTLNDVCAQTAGSTLPQLMVEAAAQAECCEAEQTDNCDNACHLAIYPLAQQQPLALLKLRDGNIVRHSPRLSSLNPAPLVRPPLVV
ncbi:MAG: hypothetical protein RPT25_14705 [Cycloclasticus sp.]